jgi:hypothetical protein
MYMSQLCNTLPFLHRIMTRKHQRRDTSQGAETHQRGDPPDSVPFLLPPFPGYELGDCVSRPGEVCLVCHCNTHARGAAREFGETALAEYGEEGRRVHRWVQDRRYRPNNDVLYVMGNCRSSGQIGWVAIAQRERRCSHRCRASRFVRDSRERGVYPP